MKIAPIIAYHRNTNHINTRQAAAFKGADNINFEDTTENRGIMAIVADAFKTKVKRRKEAAMQASIRFFAKENTVLAEEIKTKGTKVFKKAEERYEGLEETLEHGEGIANIYEARGKYFTLEMLKILETQGANLDEEEKEALKNEERSIVFEPDTITFFNEGKIQKIAEELPDGHYNLINFNENGKVESYYKEASRLDDAGFEAPEGYIYENGKLKTCYKDVIKAFIGGHYAKSKIDFDQKDGVLEITTHKNITYGTNSVKTGEIITYRNESPVKYIKNRKETHNSTTETETIYTFNKNKLTEFTKNQKQTKDGKTTQDVKYTFNSRTGKIEYCSKENNDKGKKSTLRRLWFENGNPAKYQENEGPVFALKEGKWRIV